MKSLTTIAILIAACVAAVSCANTTAGNRSADPFVGFFADPRSCALELMRADGENKYRGFIWADFQFPVELTRNGDIATGTYDDGHPLRVEHTPQGMVVTADGDRSVTPLKRYKDRKTFEASVAPLKQGP